MSHVASASQQLEALALSILQSIVAHPEVASVTTVDGPSESFVIQASVHPDDTGQVIGRGGSTVSAVRNIVEFAASRAGVHATFELPEH